MSAVTAIRNWAAIIVLGATALLAGPTVATAQDPAEPVLADLLGLVALQLPPGVTIGSATPAQLQQAVYAAVRAAVPQNPAMATRITAAVSLAAPTAAAGMAQAALDAVADAAAANEITQDVAAQAATDLSETAGQGPGGTSPGAVSTQSAS